jgi:hypothetical protein
VNSDGLSQEVKNFGLRFGPGGGAAEKVEPARLWLGGGVMKISSAFIPRPQPAGARAAGRQRKTCRCCEIHRWDARTVYKSKRL